MKVLTVFIDGLKPESIQYMPFLDGFSTKRRVIPELGYSNPCHASMYTGVHPNKHLKWFIWKYSPDTSPFKLIEKSKIYEFPHNLYTKYACYRIAKFFNRDITSFYGMPFMYWIPIKNWHYFDLAEKKFWSDSNFIENYPTIFDLLRINSIPYEVIGMERKHANESSKIIEQHTFNGIKPWTYLFIGDIDPLSHKYGQDSVQVRERLKKIDQILEKIYISFEKKSDTFCFMLFSDHGHIKVKDKIDLHSFFRVYGGSLTDYIHFIDSNYARFWFRNEKERKEVTRILLEMGDKGFILTEEHFKKYNVNMPDNRYGDLIFYLDTPHQFDRGQIAVMGKQRTTSDVSAHGYLPEYPDSNGVFISNKNVVNDSHIRLADISPSIMDIFSIKIPDYMDGKIIWR